ncbi:MAG: hypothetical protein HY751_09975 [Nitrospinae bacterium]|nr:hypothetical protein [Nitrospinota bacterium]
MILGHVTNTFMLHSVGSHFLKDKLPPLPPVLAGALAPDILDKAIMVTGLIESYPGRGLFHSLVTLTVLAVPAIRAFPARAKLVGAVYLGALVHLAQDTPDLSVILWPLAGPWEPYPYMSLVEKLVNLYIGMNPLQAWLGEMAGAIYCAGYFVTRILKWRAKKKNDVSLVEVE